MGLIPDWGTKVPHAAWWPKNKIKPFLSLTAVSLFLPHMCFQTKIDMVNIRIITSSLLVQNWVRMGREGKTFKVSLLISKLILFFISKQNVNPFTCVFLFSPQELPCEVVPSTVVMRKLTPKQVKINCPVTQLVGDRVGIKQIDSWDFSGLGFCTSTTGVTVLIPVNWDLKILQAT